MNSTVKSVGPINAYAFILILYFSLLKTPMFILYKAYCIPLIYYWKLEWFFATVAYSVKPNIIITEEY